MESLEYALRLGQAVRLKRQELGVSQDDFAEKCGLHRTYIGSIERGERNVSLRNIVVIANAIGVSASELLRLSKL